MPNTNRIYANSSEKTGKPKKAIEKELDLLRKTSYSNKVVQLYFNRVNVRKMENADVALAYTGPCSDTIKFYLKIERNNKIEDASFQYLGCPASAACDSILSQFVKGISLEKAKEITENEILKELGGLPGDECHCAKLAVTTLHKTIARFERRKQQLSKTRSILTEKFF